MKQLKFMAAAAATALVLAACGDAGGDDGVDDSEIDVAEDVDFEEGTRMAELAESGNVRIGVKFDQPGIGFQAAGEDAPTGFDPEMGKLIAAELGIEPGDIEWVETVSDNREPFLQQDTVDFVIASYSITDERREVVGQAGPYYVTGQQILVAADSDIEGPEDVAGVDVCSVTGSTSIAQIEEMYDATPRGFDTYSECVEQLENGTVEAVTTDGAILLGYAADSSEDLEVVGEAFSEERYGIGYSLEYPELCEFLNEVIENSYDEGTWERAFEATLGGDDVEVPEQPELDPCEG